jgi:hypothetical protein
MLGNPTVNEIVHGQRGMLKGIQACVDAFCLVSAITLIYSSIDALAALTIPIQSSKSKGADFEAWVDRYFIPSLTAGLSAKDLWAARCGILHAYSRHSDLSRSATSRSLIYKWRTAHHPNDVKLQNEAAAGAVIVEVESLVDAFCSAVMEFQKEIDREVDLRQRVQHHVQGLLCYKPSMPVLLPALSSAARVA